MPALPAGSYIAIPCTFDMGVLGPFQVLVYANDPEATLAPVANQWKYAREIRVRLRSLSEHIPIHSTSLQANNNIYISKINDRAK